MVQIIISHRRAGREITSEEIHPVSQDQHQPCDEEPEAVVETESHHDKILPLPTNLVKESANVPSVTRSGRVTRKPKYVQQYYKTF